MLASGWAAGAPRWAQRVVIESRPSCRPCHRRLLNRHTADGRKFSFDGWKSFRSSVRSRQGAGQGAGCRAGGGGQLGASPRLTSTGMRGPAPPPASAPACHRSRPPPVPQQLLNKGLAFEFSNPKKVALTRRWVSTGVQVAAVLAVGADAQARLPRCLLCVPPYAALSTRCPALPCRLRHAGASRWRSGCIATEWRAARCSPSPASPLPAPCCSSWSS